MLHRRQCMSYQGSEREPRGPTWGWHERIPDVLLGVALVALIALVVALALGWIV